MIDLEKVARLFGGRAPVAAPSGSTVVRDVTRRRAAATATPARSPLPSCETRSAERIVPRTCATVLTTSGGKRIAARIINLSATGVALEPEAADFDPEEVAMVGSRPVVRGRNFSNGLVFTFKNAIDARIFSPEITL